jgi:hypothetical protein
MDVYTDIVHVRQPGREALAGEMSLRLHSNQDFMHCLR